MKILLVDGVALDREFVAEALSSLEVVQEVRLARNGREALEYLARAILAPPSLILTEADLPDVNGFELIEAVRNDHRLCVIPILVLSSRCDQAYVNRAYRLGANAYICKTRENFGVVIQDLARFWLRRARLPEGITEPIAG